MSQKAYLSSRNLIKPVELTSNDKEFLIYKDDINNMINNISPVYINTYDTDILGNCQYRQYNLKRGSI